MTCVWISSPVTILPTALNAADTTLGCGFINNSTNRRHTEKYKRSLKIQKTKKSHRISCSVEQTRDWCRKNGMVLDFESYYTNQLSLWITFTVKNIVRIQNMFNLDRFYHCWSLQIPFVDIPQNPNLIHCKILYFYTFLRKMVLETSIAIKSLKNQ